MNQDSAKSGSGSVNGSGNASSSGRVSGSGNSIGSGNAAPIFKPPPYVRKLGKRLLKSDPSNFELWLAYARAEVLAGNLGTCEQNAVNHCPLPIVMIILHHRPFSLHYTRELF